MSRNLTASPGRSRIRQWVPTGPGPTARARRGLSLVEALLALVVGSLALVPILNMSSTVAEEVQDASVFLELLEQAQQDASGAAPTSRDTAYLMVNEHTVESAGRRLTWCTVVAEPHGSFLPRLPVAPAGGVR